MKTLELKSGQLSSLLGHEDEVQSVIFDHKAEHLVSGGSDGTVRIWNWDAGPPFSETSQKHSDILLAMEMT